MEKRIVVLGLGNRLMSDEGVGSHIVERFQTQADKYPLVDFIDAGTGGMSILHRIKDHEKAVIIDCAYMKTKPGTIKKFRPDEVKSVKKLAHHSLHDVDVLKIIELSKQLDQCPDKIVIFGIEPEKIEQSYELSSSITARIDDYIITISQELIL